MAVVASEWSSLSINDLLIIQSREENCFNNIHCRRTCVMNMRYEHAIWTCNMNMRYEHAIIEHLGVLYSNWWLTQCIPQRVYQQSEEEVLSVVRAHWQWCCHREDTQWGGQGGMSVPTGRSLPRPWSKKGPNWTELYLLCVEVPMHLNVLTLTFYWAASPEWAADQKVAYRLSRCGHHLCDSGGLFQWL